MGLEGRAQSEAADFLQRAGDARRVARELDRGRVSEELALPRDGRLDQPAEEVADVTDDQQRNPGQQDPGDHAAGALAPGAHPAERPEDAAAGEAQHEDAEHDRGDAKIHPHIAI